MSTQEQRNHIWLVSSIAAQSPTAARAPALPFAQGWLPPLLRGSPTRNFCEGPPCTLPTACPFSTPPHSPAQPLPQVEDFSIRGRVYRHFHGGIYNPARQIQQFLQTGLDPSEVGRPVLTALHGLVAALQPHIAAAHGQAQSAGQHAEEGKGGRPHWWNPFHHGRNRSGKEGGEDYDGRHAGRAHRLAHRLHAAAEAKEREMDPLGAAELFRQAYEADPRQFEWLSMQAKQWSDASYLEDCLDPQLKLQHNIKAIELASQAIELEPEASHGYIARCISSGRKALLCDNRTKVQLAASSCDDAKQALALEPNNDYAHHLMGRWHYEMAGLNAVARTLVRLLFGAALMQGTYPCALYHFKSAVELAPHRLIHRVEHGRTLAKLGETQKAMEELQTALECEVVDLNAHLQRLDAEIMLAQLEASPAAKRLFLSPASLGSNGVPNPPV